MTWRGWGIPLGNPGSMSLNASYHKEQVYIWLRGGDLNSFRDMRPFMKRRGGAYPREPMVCVIGCVLS